MDSLASVGLGVLIAWGITTSMIRPKKSYFTLKPWPIDVPNDNLALIGVGLASYTAKPSVMDASASPAPVVMMEPQTPASTTMTQIAPGPTPLVMTVPTSPAPVALPQTTLMPPQLTPAPMASQLAPVPMQMVTAPAPSPSA
jgi:hypothetical protein